MKTCKNCGAELSDTAKFCKNCGTKVSADSIIEDTEHELVNSKITESEINKPQEHDPNTIESDFSQERHDKSKIESSVRNHQKDNEAKMVSSEQTDDQKQTRTENMQQKQMQSNKITGEYQHANNGTQKNMERMQYYGKSYISYLIERIKHPSHQAPKENQYYGLVNFGITALLLTLTAWQFTKQIGVWLMNIIMKVPKIGHLSRGDILDGQQTIQDNLDGFIQQSVSGLYIKIFIAILLYFALFIIVGYFIRHFAMKNATSIQSYIHDLGSYSAIMVPTSLLMFLFAIVSVSATFKINVVLLMICAVVFQVSFILVTSKGKDGSLDRVYAVAIALLIIQILLVIFFKQISYTYVSKLTDTQSMGDISSFLYYLF